MGVDYVNFGLILGVAEFYALSNFAVALNRVV